MYSSDVIYTRQHNKYATRHGTALEEYGTHARSHARTDNEPHNKNTRTNKSLGLVVGLLRLDAAEQRVGARVRVLQI